MKKKLETIALANKMIVTVLRNQLSLLALKNTKTGKGVKPTCRNVIVLYGKENVNNTASTDDENINAQESIIFNAKT